MKRGITALVVLGAVAAVNGGHHHASRHHPAAKHHTAHHDDGYHKAKVVKHLNLGGPAKHHHIEHASVAATVSKEQAMEKQELEMALKAATKTYAARPRVERDTALAFAGNSFIEVTEDVDTDETPTNKTNHTATGGPPAPKPKPSEPEDPVFAAAKKKVEMTKEACDKATVMETKATEAYEEERDMLVGKLKTAHIAITGAHQDQKEAAGDQVLGGLEQALDDTKSTLSMRPKVKALRRVKDKASVTQKKACLTYKGAMDELEALRDERIKRARAAYEKAKSKIVLTKSQLKAMMAISAHVSLLARDDVHNETGTAQDSHITLKLKATTHANEAALHAKKYLRAVKDRKNFLLAKMNSYLAEAGRPQFVEKEEKDEDTSEKKEPPSWGTPELDDMAVTVQEKVDSANQIRGELEQVIGQPIAQNEVEEPSASGPEDSASGPVSASGPADDVEAIAANATDASTPLEVLKKRMTAIAKMASEMLGGPKQNNTDASGASGAAEDEDENAASGPPEEPEDMSGPEYKTLTRTFVSNGATSTVTTIFHKKGDSKAALWKKVKALEAQKKSEAGGASATGGATGEASPLEKKLAELEAELRGSSGSSGASGPVDASGSAGDSSGSSGAAAATPINGVTDATILKLIASRMDGSNATSDTPGDDQPFADSKTIANIAKQIAGVDTKDADALFQISKKLAGADSVSGLEKGGIDEGEDAKALRKIADSLLKLTGLPGIPTGATGAASGSAAADAESGSAAADASGSSGGEGKKDEKSRITLPQDMGKSGGAEEGSDESGGSGASGASGGGELLSLHKKVSELEQILGISGASGPSDSESGASGAAGEGSGSGSDLKSAKKKVDELEKKKDEVSRVETPQDAKAKKDKAAKEKKENGSGSGEDEETSENGSGSGSGSGSGKGSGSASGPEMQEEGIILTKSKMKPDSGDPKWIQPSFAPKNSLRGPNPKDMNVRIQMSN